MRKYLVINTKTKKSVMVDLEEAARISRLDPGDIEWAIENEDLCQTERHTITETIVPESPHKCCNPVNGRSQDVSVQTAALLDLSAPPSNMQCLPSRTPCGS